MKKALYALFLSFVLIASCTKDYFNGEKLEDAFDNLQWDPEIAIPLVYSSYSIDDLLSETAATGLIQIGSDKLVTLIYEDELFSLSAEDALVIPSQSFNNSFSQPVSIPSYAGNSISFNGNQNNAFTAGSNNQMDSIHLKGGVLNLNFSSTFQHDVVITLSIPSAKKNGIPYSQTANLTYTGSSPVNQTISSDLTGYVFDLTSNGTTYNELNVSYSIAVNGNGNAVNAGDQISISGSMTGLRFSKIFGYIDISGVSTAADSVELSIFKLAQGIGQFKLVNPSVTFTIKNSIGIPLQCSFNPLMGLNTNSGSSYNLATNPDVPNPLPILSPNFTQIGQTLSNSFTVSNQGMVDLINDQPGFIVYGVNAATASTANHQSFVLDSSRFSVNAKVEMPLYGRADIFTLRDTMDFSLEGSDSTSSSGGASSSDTSSLDFDLVSLTLKSIIRNQFPLDILMQGYFLNENNVILDSLLNGFTTIPSAQVDANGRSTISGVLNVESVFTKERVTAFENIKKIVIVAKATTLANATQDVKIYSDYRMSVKMGVKTKLTTKK